MDSEARVWARNGLRDVAAIESLITRVERSLHVPSADPGFVLEPDAHDADRDLCLSLINKPVNPKQTRMIMGVTTWNRLPFLRRFIESFLHTKSDAFEWTLVVADDGSTDGTIDYVRSLSRRDCAIVLIHNNNQRVASQTNSIFRAARALGFDFGFKADDDVFFTDGGWDRAYFDAAMGSGFHHLVYHNEDWRAPVHRIRRNGLLSLVSADESLGCFYTFSPAVLEEIGYFDAYEFRLRGHSHWDFTKRACRAGYNELNTLWDVWGSDRYIGMWSREEYRSVFDWGAALTKAVLTPAERVRRDELLESPDRVSVDDVEPVRIGDLRIETAVISSDERKKSLTQELLTATPYFRVMEGVSGEFDRIYVLNLRRQRGRWVGAAETLSRAGLTFQRFPATDGYEDHVRLSWEAYEAQGLTQPIEKQLGRKLIQSPGAWGYLETMQRLLETALENRFRRILVFDDDVRLHDSFASAVMNAWSELPDNWKLVYLGCTQTDWSAVRLHSQHWYHPGCKADGSFAFALDASVFERALKSVRDREWPFDSGALREVNRAFPESTFAAKPPLAIADLRESSIRESRDLGKHAARARWRVGRYVSRPDRARLVEGHPRVSLIALFESPGYWIRDTIAALRYQTMGDFELLVLDSLLPGAWSSWLRSAAAMDPRVRLLSGSRAQSSTEAFEMLLDLSRSEVVGVVGREVSFRRRLESCLAGFAGSGAPLIAARVLHSPCQGAGDSDGLEALEAWSTRHATGQSDPQVRFGLVRRAILTEIIRKGGHLGLNGLDQLDQMVNHHLGAESVEELPWLDKPVATIRRGEQWQSSDKSTSVLTAQRTSVELYRAD